MRLSQYSIDEPTRKSFQSLVPEERRGRVRWLRPEFQDPGGTADAAAVPTETAPIPAAADPAGPRADWPRTLPEQFQALIASESTRWQKLIRDLNISLD